MADAVVTRLPFSDKGISQKLDINQLSDGQYAYLLNLVSEQEGSLSPRYGYVDIPISSWGVGRADTLFVNNPYNASAIHPNIYVGEGTNIRRVSVSTSPSSSPTSPSGTSTTISSGAMGAAKRIGFTHFGTDQYNQVGMVYGATGYSYIGTGGDAFKVFRGVVRDNGSYSTAREVGILPPVISAKITPAAPANVTLGTCSSATRVSTTTSGGVPTGSDPYGSDYYTIPTTDITGLVSGAYVVVGTGGGSGEIDGPVGDIQATPSSVAGSFFVASGTTPSISSGATVKVYKYWSSDKSPSLPMDADTQTITGTANWTLTGLYQNGYDSNDKVHLSFYNGTPGNIATVTLRINCGSGYYEKVISFGSTAPDGTTNPYWYEVDIPKTDFTKNGTGSGNNSWINVGSATLVVTPYDPTVTYTYNIGQLYATGHGGLNSGSAATLTPYDYVYTYVDPESGAESNPSQLMNPASALSVTNQGIKVTVWGTDKVGTAAGSNAGITKIAIYRRGGSFTDGLFRKVGYVDNPGMDSYGALTPTVFIDNADDASIAAAPTASFDNDAPVTADLSKEYIFSIGNSGTTVGYSTVSVYGLGGTDLRTILTNGTIITVGNNISSPNNGSEQIEQCYAFNVTSTTFDTSLNYPHAQYEQISWSTNAGSPGDIIYSAMESLWMAGVSLTPHVLYRSKTGQPESWPTINEATGNAHNIIVSTPDNPIMGIAEFNGEMVVLCLHGIYTVRLDSGRLVGPFKTPANRGLTQKHCWAYVDNEIWFLSYDGIYAWSGGAVRKVSFDLDFVFTGRQVNGIAPLNQSYTGTGSDSSYPTLATLAQKGNEVYFSCNCWVPGTTSTSWYIFRYNLLFNRWSIDEVYDTNSISTVTRNGVTLNTTAVTAMSSNRATGDLVTCRSTVSAGPTTGAYLAYYNNVGTYQDGSHSVYYDGIGKYYDFGAPLVKKRFTDIGVELNSGASASPPVTPSNSNNSFNIQFYYDYNSSVDSNDQFKLTPASAGRQIISLPLQQTGSPLASTGKEGRAIQWEVFGTSNVANSLNGISFATIPQSDLIKGRITDWDDLGHPYDKRLQAVTIEYDNGNNSVQVYLDVTSGIAGGTQSLAAQTLTLPAAVGRAKISIPITEGTVAKMVRLRPVVASSQYQIFNYKFVQDNYPKDKVYFTDYSDQGYPYEKRLYQLYINCDTGGQNVNVDIVGDNSTLQTVVVNGTAADRMQAIPLAPDLIAKLIKLSAHQSDVDATNAKFQLFDYKFDFEQLPRPIVESTPWTDFGYDYTKHAEQIAFDVNTNNQSVPVKVYTDGTLSQTVYVTGTHSNRNVNVTLNPSIDFKQMRLVVDPTAIPSGGRFQLWEYKAIWDPADKGAVHHSFDWDDLGVPYDKKISEVTIEFETGHDSGDTAIQIAIDTLSGIDGNTPALAPITLSLPNSSGVRGKKTFPIPETVCKMVRIRSLGQSAGGTQSPLFKMFGYQFSNTVPYPQDKFYFTDYSDQGYQYEKRLYQLYINCDTNGQTVNVDIIGDGSTLQTVQVNGSASNRMQAIPLNPDLIARLIRLNCHTGDVDATNAKFQLFDYKFDYEQLPKPTILSTPWSNDGYAYTKIAEQAVFDCNTNGQTIPVQIWADGSLKQTVSVNTTHAARLATVTLNPAIYFQQMRIIIDPTAIPSGGRFQLWEFKPIWRQADKGAVYHSFDWDDLGHSYDKKISEVTIEFETGHDSGDTSIQLALDTLTGIDGTTQNLDAITLTLPNSSGHRGFKTFSLPETICKEVRIRSLGQAGGGTQSPAFKMWSYKFGGTINYPADIVQFTEWTNAGTACAKIFRGVGIQIDTGGVNCTVGLQVDNVTVQTWTINTTSPTRQTFETPVNATEINGYLYRLTFTPGSGGKAQLFGQPEWNLVKDSCDFVVLDTFNQAFGSVGYTIIKQAWADYKCAGTVTMTFYREDGTQFYQQILPAHSTRSAERFYLPSVNNGVKNKDKKHRIVITANDPTKPFRWYRDSSRFEVLNLSEDQRGGVYQTIYWTNIDLQV